MMVDFHDDARSAAAGREADARPLMTARPSGEKIDDAVAATRRVIDALLRTDHMNPGLVEIARRLDEIAEDMVEHIAPERERIKDMWTGEGAGRHDPVTGVENALAPPLVVYGDVDGWVEGTVTLGLPYQGPPGCVHGGYSALMLDHVLGIANHHGIATGVTAALTTNYRRPTPLFRELTIRARQESVEGRKIHARAEILCDGEVCVEATGLFIIVDSTWHIANATRE